VYDCSHKRDEDGQPSITVTKGEERHNQNYVLEENEATLSHRMKNGDSYTVL
jgi:hypothetical protein